MKILVTGGNTFVPIDKVRGISNIFRGRTGCDIATEAAARGYSVTLLGNIWMRDRVKGLGLNFVPFKTFDDLMISMRGEILTAPERPDVVIHSAAISDYRVARIYPTPEHDWQDGTDQGGPDKGFCPRCGIVEDEYTKLTRCIPECLPQDGKIASSHPFLTIDLVPTEKIVDKIRKPWCFKGVLVKFKLQVGMNDSELLSVAKKSMEASDADVMVANCLEWARERAYILAGHEVQDVQRCDLAKALLDRVERLHNQKIVESAK